MSLRSKPLWFEGMFVRPQHFQQYDRWIESSLDARVQAAGPHFWGIKSLAFDKELLDLGKLSIAQCTAVMRDGLPIAIPNDVTAPAPRDISADTQDALIRLAVPLKPRDGAEVSGSDGTPRRYRSTALRVQDSTRPDRSAGDLHVGQPDVRLLIGDEPEQDQIALPIGLIRNVEGTKINLAEDFIPPTVSVSSSSRLVAMAREVLALLASRGDALASRAEAGQSQGDASGLSDMLTLMAVNRSEMTMKHLLAENQLHPWVLYSELVELIGTLSALSVDERRPEAAAAYDHTNLSGTFDDALRRLRKLLNIVVVERAIRLPLKPAQYGIWVGEITDRTIFKNHRFVMAVVADMPGETIQRHFPTQTKIGPLERIRDLVNLQLPGIQLSQLPVAPREIKYLRGGVYFELDQTSDLWGQLGNSTAFAMHVSGDYPNLHLELWAIRED